MGSHKRQTPTSTIALSAASLEAAACLLAGEQSFNLRQVLSQDPVCCLDIQASAQQAHNKNSLLIVDNRLTAHACNPVHLGADAAFLSSSGNAYTLMLTSELLSRVPCSYELASFEPTNEAILEWSRMSDVALAYASYLVCHPCVSVCTYPGLRQDKSYLVASKTLMRGFGPYVSYKTSDSDLWHTHDVRGSTLQELIFDFEGMH